jgi:hypothetical protein
LITDSYIIDRVPALPKINFTAHETRVGRQGAAEDFEQMLGLLVQATYGGAHLVYANPGDWGIDVLVGDLNSRVMIWQAKYFIREFKDPQKRQVEESFRSAMSNSRRRGYTVDRWILCVPISLDPLTTQWWQRWQAEREREHPGMSVELWDENQLRSLLIDPAAAHVCGAYYDLHPGRHDDGEPESRPPKVWPTTPLAPWRGGAEYQLDRDVYLLHHPTYERTSSDMSCLWREATAERIEPTPLRVRIRQVRMDRPTTTAEEQIASLRAQGALLTELGGRAGLPQFVRESAERTSQTLVTAHPSGRTWRALFGLGPGAADLLTAAAALATAADVAAPLTVLHEHRVSHRALDPDALFVDGTRCRLRDGGLAAIPPVVGEGAIGVTGPPGADPAGAIRAGVWQAPEQRRSPGETGPATDVYRLAAIVYHTLTGHPPTPTSSPPVRAALLRFPDDADRTVMQALGADPVRRPGIRQLAAAFRDAERALSRGSAA